MQETVQQEVGIRQRSSAIEVVCGGGHLWLQTLRRARRRHCEVAGGGGSVYAQPVAHVRGVRHLINGVDNAFKSQLFQRRPSTATNALSSRRRTFLEVYNLKRRILLQRHSLRLVVAHWKVHIFCGLSNYGKCVKPPGR